MFHFVPILLKQELVNAAQCCHDPGLTGQTPTRRRSDQSRVLKGP
jgi:hypothetical protein